MSIGKITHTIKYGSQYLNSINENQVFYALASVQHEMPEGVNRQPVNLCLVIDTSTSMKGRPLEVVKRTLINLHHYLSQDDYVSVVVFNDRADTLLRPTKISDFGNLTRYVMRMHAEGGTEIYQGLKRGYVQLVRSPIFRKSTSLLLLLTDGQTYGDDEMCMRLVRSANQEGVTFSAFGLGDDWNDEFLDRLVGYSGGEVAYLSDVEEFEALLGAYLAGSQQIDIPQLFINFETHPAVEISNMYRMKPGVMPLLSSNSSYCLGSMVNGVPSVYLFEFTIKPITGVLNRLDLLRGIFEPRNIPKGIKFHSEKISLSVSLDLSKEKPNTPDGLVIESVYHISLYRMQAAARKMIRQGDINSGISTLKNLARQLKSQGQENLATSVLEETQYIEENQRYSGSGEKRIKFGTRVLPVVTRPVIRSAPTRKVDL
jgi:Ca-activated chloride channel family protein